MVKVKVTYDSNGNITGYYPDTINYESIPETYIEIDQVTWQDCINNPGLRRVNVVNNVIVEYTPPEPASQIVTPGVDENIADLYQALLDMSARLEKLEGGN